jgi:hypothetical protein
LAESGDLMSEFIGEEIEVTTAVGGSPSAFTWGGRRYEIVDIRGMRRRLDFVRRWYQRRHRDEYVVRTDSGQTFLMYFNRGPGRRYWVLHEKLE